MSAAYPLTWPADWPRSKERERSRFRATLSSALNFLQGELRLIGAKNIVISSNDSIGESRPADPGVAVYFTLDKLQLCMPCDRYTLPEDNFRAIAKMIEAMRGIERWGAKDMLRRAFSGFKSLPPPGGNPDEIDWRNTLIWRRVVLAGRSRPQEMGLSSQSHGSRQEGASIAYLTCSETRL